MSSAKNLRIKNMEKGTLDIFSATIFINSILSIRNRRLRTINQLTLSHLVNKCFQEDLNTELPIAKIYAFVAEAKRMEVVEISLRSPVTLL